MSSSGDYGRAAGPRAGFSQRFFAYLLDGLILGVVGLVLEALLRSAGYYLSVVVGVAYFVYLEGGSTGQTYGKRALGIRVIDFEAGGPIGYGRALVRYLGRIIGMLALFLGLLWMLWDREKQCWHDKFADDLVVPVMAYPIHGPPQRSYADRP